MTTNILKNKSIKSLVAFLVIGAILLNSHLSISQAADAEELPSILTMSEALELAAINNLDIKIAEAEMNRTNISKSQQSGLAKADASTGSYDGDLMIEVAKVNKKLLPQLTEASFDTKKIEVELSVKSAYSQLVYAKEAFELAKKYKVQTGESYEFIQKKYGLGQASNIEVLSAEAEVSAKDSELIQAEITYKQKLMDMNQLMGQQLDKEWSLDKEVATSVIELPASEVMKTHMNANHPMILSSNLNYNIAETTFDLAKGYYPPNVWTYRYAEQDFNKAKYQHELTLLSQEKNLSQAYIGLKGSVESLKALEKSVENISESYRISKVRFELGMITSHDLNEALLALQRMENNLLNARLNYQLSIAQLEYISGYKIVK
ncbi:MAG: hypothetical protein CVV02_15860 [Firmicutes bacterium HGW-Firmicutes-7]|nr:MAG: hypothetical protein CVV02_15860 [Firmicutes bacterium HGW-Firmicutes-7]